MGSDTVAQASRRVLRAGRAPALRATGAQAACLARTRGRKARDYFGGVMEARSARKAGSALTQASFVVEHISVTRPFGVS